MNAATRKRLEAAVLQQLVKAKNAARARVKQVGLTEAITRTQLRINGDWKDVKPAFEREVLEALKAMERNEVPHGVCPKCGSAQFDKGCTNDECVLFGSFA